MSAPLLTTKLYIPPVRPELVPRPRLLERLNAGLHRKLALMRSIGLIIRPGRLWQDHTAEREGPRGRGAARGAPTGRLGLAGRGEQRSRPVSLLPDRRAAKRSVRTFERVLVGACARHNRCARLGW